jgi:hypothetical protein
MKCMLFDRERRTARRLDVSPHELAALMRALPAHQAIGFFTISEALPDEVRILSRGEMTGEETDAIALPPEWEQ